MTEVPPLPPAAPDWDAYRRRGFVRLVALLLRPPPEALAAGKGLLTRAEARAVSAWLRPLEQIVRLLLSWTVMLMPAGAAAPWPTPSPDRARPSPRRRDRERRPPGFALWSCASGPSGAAPPENAATGVSAWRLVARLEAVLAVARDPKPCLARLARRWGREAGPATRRAARGTRRPRVSELARPWLLAEARELLAQAAAFDTG